MKIDSNVHTIITSRVQTERAGARLTIVAGIIFAVSRSGTTMLLGGCHGGGIEKGVDSMKTALTVLDVVVDESTGVWRNYTEREIERCRALDLETPEERADCLGPAAKAPEVKDALEKIVAAQHAMVDAIEALEAVAPALEAAKAP